MAVDDPVLPAAPLLLGEEAGDMLRTVMADIGEVHRWWRSQTRHVPGRQLVVRYGVEIGWPDGRTSVETLVAEQSTAEPPEGTSILQTPDGDTIWVWRYPFDPHLPGLAAAAHPSAVRDLLDRLHVPEGRIALRPLAYRASRRAVLEVTREGGPDGPRRWFAKVVPPRRTRRIRDVHLAVARVLPAPLPLAADIDAGTLLLSEVPGRSLRELLVDPTAPLPDVAQVVALQQQLAAVRTGVRKAPPRPFGVRRGADGLRALLPEHADVIEAVAAAAEAAEDPADPVVTIHGDLHEAQILVDDQGVLGLVDLDGTGPGALLDDAATMLAHLWLVGRWHPSTRARSDAMAGQYHRAIGALLDPGRVSRRAAGVMLGLAGGSFTAADASWRAEAVARLDAAARLAGVPAPATT